MKVAVVGGGLAGLLAAGELRRAGVGVTVFEATDRPGGVADTIHDRGYLLEPAAGSFLLPHPVLSPLLEAAGVEVLPMPGASRRWYWNGRGEPIELPSAPPDFARSPMLGPIAKLRAAGEVVVRSRSEPGETLAAYLTRRFGRGAGRVAGHLAASGVFAGDSEALEAASAFPQLLALENPSVLRSLIRRRGRSGDRPRLHVPREGMDDLALRLAKYAGDVRYGFPVGQLSGDFGEWEIGGDVFEHVVMTTQPSTLASMLTDPSAPAPTAPVAVVGVGGPADAVPMPDGFGLLTGPDAGLPVLGVLFEAAPSRAPDGHHLLKVLVGGARHPEIDDWTDDVVVEATLTGLGRIFGSRPQPDWTRVVRQRIPQYRVGHAERVAKLEERLPATVHLGGWWHRGIGIGSLALDAARVTAAIQEAP